MSHGSHKRPEHTAPPELVNTIHIDIKILIS